MYCAGPRSNTNWFQTNKLILPFWQIQADRDVQLSWFFFFFNVSCSIIQLFAQLRSPRWLPFLWALFVLATFFMFGCWMQGHGPQAVRETQVAGVKWHNERVAIRVWLSRCHYVRTWPHTAGFVTSRVPAASREPAKSSKCVIPFCLERCCIYARIYLWRKMGLSEQWQLNWNATASPLQLACLELQQSLFNLCWSLPSKIFWNVLSKWVFFYTQVTSVPPWRTTWSSIVRLSLASFLSSYRVCWEFRGRSGYNMSLFNIPLGDYKSNCPVVVCTTIAPK